MKRAVSQRWLSMMLYWFISTFFGSYRKYWPSLYITLTSLSFLFLSSPSLTSSRGLFLGIGA